MRTLLLASILAALAFSAATKRVDKHKLKSSLATESTFASSGPLGELATPFAELSAPAKVEDLQAALEVTVTFLEGSGFAEGADYIKKNAAMLSECSPGATIESCLQAEVERGVHTPQDKAKQQATGKKVNGAAKLKDPSPASGLLWTMRHLGFLTEMFQGFGAGKPIKQAATDAYYHRLAVAYDQSCTWCTDYAILTALKTGIMSGMEKKAAALVEHAGGEDVAKSDMRAFSAVVLPIVDGILAEIAAHNLDDTKS